MVTFQYRGYVLPKEQPLTLAYSPISERAAVDEEPSGRFALSVQNGRLQVEVTVERFERRYVEALHGAAYDLARSAVEVSTFATGIAHMVVINEAVHPDGAKKTLILGDNRLRSVCKSYSAHEIEAVTDLVLQDIDFARVLSDAVIVLSWPHYAPIACGRVADSLVRMITGGRTAAHWEQMRNTLRVERPYLELLTTYATPPRHGDRQPVDGKTTSELAERAWTLLDRYIAYRLGSSAPLDPARFPVLTA